MQFFFFLFHWPVIVKIFFTINSHVAYEISYNMTQHLETSGKYERILEISEIVKILHF